MTKYTITPWRKQADLLQIRQQLYADASDPDSRRYAVDRVMAWKLRGNLPHAVESTALLVDAILHHRITTNSIFSLRAVYSAAFCRFVTGFCDIGRHRERTLEPSSMLDIAKQIDMPVEFVALRHEATHEELPNIHRLVTATGQALEWLWKVYWSRLEEPGDAETDRAELVRFKAEVMLALRNFRRSRRDAIRNATHISPAQTEELTRIRDALLNQCQYDRSRTKAFADVLVEERLLFPASRELGSLLDGAFLIWDDLLLDLSTRLTGFLQDLAISLFHLLAKTETTTPETDPQKEALAMWLLHILDFEDMQKKVLTELMKACCLYPGYWTQIIGSEVLQNADSSFKDDWEDLFVASSTEATTGAVENVIADSDALLPDGGLKEHSMDRDTSQTERQGVESIGRWRRALLPQSGPIGVVT